MNTHDLTTRTSTHDWLAQARALAPCIAQQRDTAEHERRLPRPVLDAACTAGLVRMLVPRALGGPQAGVVDALAVMEELGSQDGSIGWNLTLAIASPIFGDYLPEEVAETLFREQDTVIAGSFAPQGRAVRVAGGYCLSGRWPFMSGCQNATWMVAGGAVLEDGQPVLGPDGTPVARVFVFPVADGRVVDTWHTTGMRGTGSHDYTVTDLFVPEAWSFPFQALALGPAPRPGLGFPRPFHEVAPVFLAAVGLGVAREALDAFLTLAATKTPKGMTQPLAGQATVHERVGRAEALLRAARTYLFARAAEVTATRMEAPSGALASRLAGAYATQSAVEVVTLLHQAAGGSAIYAGNRLERSFRDIHTLSHHFVIAPGAFVAAGEWLLAQRRA
jgi:alkylation response protein AidB-like acyl-CoA dehydrogenase